MEALVFLLWAGVAFFGIIALVIVLLVMKIFWDIHQEHKECVLEMKQERTERRNRRK